MSFKEVSKFERKNLYMSTIVNPAITLLQTAVKITRCPNISKLHY